MATAPFRIALAQIDPIVGDLPNNTDRICDAIGRARALGADIVAVPEMSLTGYPPEDLLLRPHFLSDCRQYVKRIADCARGITAVVGSINVRGKKVYNSAYIFHRGRVAGIYNKQHLPNYGVFDEKRYFESGEENLIWQIGDVPVGVSVCEDIWLDEGPHADQARAGARVILNISSSPYQAGKHKQRMDMLKTRARQTGAYVCYVNLVGGQDELVFDGGSMIIGPTGKLLAEGRLFETDMVVVDIEHETAQGPRKNGPPKNPVAAKVLQPYHHVKPRPPLPLHKAPAYERWEEVYRALMLGVRDYVNKNGFDKVVIGLSGGIDSTLTAAISADALGKDRVIGVTMPSQYTSSGTFTDAGRTAENLGMRMLTLPIEGIFKSYLDDLAETFDAMSPDATEENLQARIRGNLLMALSNKFGWLVVTTGNKSETSVGYSTLYGDMAGGFSLLKDVPKTWVYELSNYRNRKAGWDIIPQSVIDRVPSAELRPNQTDQDSLPPYEVLDAIIDAYIEKDKSRAQIVAMGFDAATVKRVAGMIDRNEYKRRQAPPGLKITPKAFGRDRRMPITNRYV